MHCEKVRLLILDEGRSVNDAPDWITTHLQDCESCRDIVSGAAQVKTMRNAWVDEKPPQFPPQLFPAPATPPAWFAWVPILACFIMVILTVFRVEITKSADGFSLAFGGGRQSENGELLALVDQALREEGERTTAEIQESLIEMNRRWNLRLEHAVAGLEEQSRASWRSDLQKVVTSWEEQRSMDLTLMENQINLILSRQEKNASHLFQLASYMSDNPK